jgi:hypothetical protein
VRPVDGDERRPLFRLSDLATALERHRAAPDKRTTAVKNALPPELEAMIAEYEQLDAAVRAAPNFVEARRRLRPLLQHLAMLVTAMHQDAEAAYEVNGSFRVTCFEHTALAALREVVGKSFDDLHAEYCRLAHAVRRRRGGLNAALYKEANFATFQEGERKRHEGKLSSKVESPNWRLSKKSSQLENFTSEAGQIGDLRRRDRPGMEIHWHQTRDKNLSAVLVENTINETGTWVLCPLIVVGRIATNKIGNAGAREEFWREAHARLDRLPLSRGERARVEAMLAEKLGGDGRKIEIEISKIDLRWIGAAVED